MASVAFLRGANVGGAHVFRPSLLAQELAHLGAINVGAAGTFVIRETVGSAALRAELLKRLPFTCEVMICRARDVIALTHAEPFPDGTARQVVRRFVHVLSRRPSRIPPLPVNEPGSSNWEVKIIGVTGPLVVSFWRQLRDSLIDANSVVEKHFGVSATTRNWNTICKIRDILTA